MKTLSRKLFLSTIIPAVLLSSSVFAVPVTGQVERIYLSDHPNGNYMLTQVVGASDSAFCYHVGQGSDLGAAVMAAYTAQVPVTISCGSSSSSNGPINYFMSIR
jgi:hypothetical protein